jgi:hypothetical protein
MLLRLFLKLLVKPITSAQRKAQNWSRYFSGQVEI